MVFLLLFLYFAQLRCVQWSIAQVWTISFIESSSSEYRCLPSHPPGVIKSRNFEELIFLECRKIISRPICIDLNKVLRLNVEQQHSVWQNSKSDQLRGSKDIKTAMFLRPKRFEYLSQASKYWEAHPWWNSNSTKSVDFFFFCFHLLYNSEKI